MERSRRYAWLAVVTAVGLSAASCGDPGPDTTPASITVSPSPVNLQSGATVQLSATVKNAAGEPIQGAVPAYTSTNGAIASVSATGLVTGAQAGSTTIGVTSGAATNSVTVNVTPGAPASLTKISVEPAAVVAGDPVGGEVRVRARDAAGNVTPGVTVTFAVTAGGGSIAPATLTTDAAGEASALFTTGKTVGVNTATASVAGIGTPVTITVTTVPGPAAYVTFASRIVTVAVGATATAAATARDANGNAISGAALTYASRTTAAATVSGPAGTITGVAVGTSVVAASLTGAASDSILAVVRATDGPVLISDLTEFAVAASADLVVTIALDMTASAEKLGSTSVKVEWDPAVLAYQSNAAPAGGPAPTVNSGNAANGSLAFSLADVSGFSGKVQLLKITFKAGAAGKTGTLRLTTSEVTAATTFTNLTAKTTAVTMPIFTK